MPLPRPALAERPARVDEVSDVQSDRRRDGWIFLGGVEAATLIPGEPPSVSHPDPPVLWRRVFDPPLEAAWQALDLAFAPRGVVDARLILTFADGRRLPQHLPKIGRNVFRAMFRPMAPLARVEVELSGSAPLDAPLELVLRSVSTWERRRALMRRGLGVLRGDPRSVPWRLARFLVQLRRQGRAVIPPAATGGSEEDVYRLWRERFDERTEDLDLHRTRVSRLVRRPLFTVVADPELTADDTDLLARSLVAQVYGGWELFCGGMTRPEARVRPAPAAAWTLEAALEQAEGDFVLLPRPGTRFRPHALAAFAALADRWPEAELLYADDDDLAGEHRGSPRFKPAWSPTRLAGRDYIGDPCCIATSRLRRSLPSTGPQSGTHGLLLRATADLPATAAVHLAQVLSHGRPPRPAPLRRPRHDLRETPLVSLVMPTRDRADLLRMSVGSIRSKTIYPNYEIIVVDNGSQEPDTHRLFAEWAQDRAVRVLHDPRPFNYSALNNRAVEVAGGALLCLINNDVEVHDPAWLDEMVGWALRPGIGCVGAKLFYPDGRLQHGGVVTGIAGAAGHRHKRARPAASGMLDELLTVNEVSAVTAACLVVRTCVYRQVGGLDENAFAVAYNDVDFCLRVLRAGYRNVWTPFATLVHHESVSRGRDLSPASAERFNQENLALRLRWADRLLADPYTSPNLTLDDETGAVRTQ